MNTRDVVLTVAVLVTGLMIGYLLGRNSILTTPQTPPSLEQTPEAAASAAAKPVAIVPKVPVQPPENTAAEKPAAKPPVAPSAPPKPQKILSPFSLSDIPLIGDPTTAKVAITVFSDFQ